MPWFGPIALERDTKFGQKNSPVTDFSIEVGVMSDCLFEKAISVLGNFRRKLKIPQQLKSRAQQRPATRLPGTELKMEGNTPVLRELPASRYNLDTYLGRVRVHNLRY